MVKITVAFVVICFLSCSVMGSEGSGRMVYKRGQAHRAVSAEARTFSDVAANKEGHFDANLYGE